MEQGNKSPLDHSKTQRSSYRTVMTGLKCMEQHNTKLLTKPLTQQYLRLSHGRLGFDSPTGSQMGTGVPPFAPRTTKMEPREKKFCSRRQCHCARLYSSSWFLAARQSSGNLPRQERLSALSASPDEDEHLRKTCD